MGGVFINYRRRDDSAPYCALYILDHLEGVVGRDRLFFDIESIPAGDDWKVTVEQSIAGSTVFLALIGWNWLEASDEAGSRRLHKEGDPVRWEIASALSADLVVIPILIEDTPMPAEEALPDDLKQLSRRQAIRISLHSIKSDLRRVEKAVKQRLGPVGHSRGVSKILRSLGLRRASSRR